MICSIFQVDVRNLVISKLNICHEYHIQPSEIDRMIYFEYEILIEEINRQQKEERKRQEEQDKKQQKGMPNMSSMMRNAQASMPKMSTPSMPKISMPNYK